MSCPGACNNQNDDFQQRFHSMSYGSQQHHMAGCNPYVSTQARTQKSSDTSTWFTHLSLGPGYAMSDSQEDDTTAAGLRVKCWKGNDGFSPTRDYQLTSVQGYQRECTSRLPAMLRSLP
jgi:hypothetical protein